MIAAWVHDLKWSYRADRELEVPVLEAVAAAFGYAGRMRRWRARQRDGWGPL